MAERLKGKQIAILATHGFEQSELTEPKRLLEAEGARVSVVSPRRKRPSRAGKRRTGATLSRSTFRWMRRIRRASMPWCCPGRHQSGHAAYR